MQPWRVNDLGNPRFSRCKKIPSYGEEDILRVRAIIPRNDESPQISSGVLGLSGGISYQQGLRSMVLVPLTKHPI